MDDDPVVKGLLKAIGLKSIPPGTKLDSAVPSPLLHHGPGHDLPDANGAPTNVKAIAAAMWGGLSPAG